MADSPRSFSSAHAEKRTAEDEHNDAAGQNACDGTELTHFMHSPAISSRASMLGRVFALLGRCGYSQQLHAVVPATQHWWNGGEGMLRHIVNDIIKPGYWSRRYTRLILVTRRARLYRVVMLLANGADVNAETSD